MTFTSLQHNGASPTIVIMDLQVASPTEFYAAAKDATSTYLLHFDIDLNEIKIYGKLPSNDGNGAYGRFKTRGPDTPQFLMIL